jgi:hypothetical protein
MPISWKHLLIFLAIIAVLILSSILWQGMRNREASEYHEFWYQVDISPSITLENVTLLLPVPSVANRSSLGEALVQGEGYEVPDTWELSLETVNGSVMLQVIAPRIVPEYHGYPLPLTTESGREKEVTFRPSATSYSNPSPVLIPVGFGITQAINRSIDTQNPFLREPLLSNPSMYQSAPCLIPVLHESCYQSTVPIYLNTSSKGEGNLTIAIASGGRNGWFEWGWTGNSYEEYVEVITTTNQLRWIEGKGYLVTGSGRYG